MDVSSFLYFTASQVHCCYVVQTIHSVVPKLPWTYCCSTFRKHLKAHLFETAFMTTA